MTVAELNGRRREAGLPLIRFDLRKLDAEDIQDLRDAYAALYEISDVDPGDNRGYWAIARGHGYDEELCHDDNRIFLTWHRAYIYVFERALSAALRAKRGDDNLWLTLPFWNWTTTDPSTDAPNGIPRVLDDPTYEDPQSGTQPNPLFRASSMFRVVSQGATGEDRFTVRDPSRFASAIPMLADDVARNLDNPDFAAFTSDLDGGAHGTVHVRVGGSGGDMSRVVSAAYDPLFWLHHSMVDKIWFDWQTARPEAPVPQHVLDASIYGGFVGREVVDAERQLLYIYSDEDPETAADVGGTVDEAAGPVAPDPPAESPAAGPSPPAESPPAGPSPPAPPAESPPAGPSPPAPPGPLAADAADDAPAGDASDGEPPIGETPPAEPPEPAEPVYLRIGPVAGPFKRAQLDFHQLRPPKKAYEMRVFLNNEGADASTPTSDPSFGGRIALFGHGACYGAPGHCDPTQAERDEYDQRRKHYLRYRKTRYTIDCTRGLRRLLRAASEPIDVHVTLVLVDASGDPVPPNSVLYRGVSLSTRS